MAGYYADNEFHMPGLDTVDPVPVEERAPVEHDTVVEVTASRDEFNDDYVGPMDESEEDLNAAEEKRHNRIKQIILKPVAAVLIGVGAILASFGVDLLGVDYLSTSYDDFFPSLPNPDPDWYGDYDWSRKTDREAEEMAREYASQDANYYASQYDEDQYEEIYKEAYQELYPEYYEKLKYRGPEIYLRYSVIKEDRFEPRYLVKGATWEYMDPDVPLTDGSEDGSISYDSTTNTLTINNFSGSIIEANMMGNAFKIRVLGENHVGYILIYGAGHSGSVTFTGDGKLTVGEEEYADLERYSRGIMLIGESGVTGEFGSACLMVDREVTLDVYGYPAIQIETTAMKDSIYYLKPIKLTGGVPESHSPYEDHPDEPGMSDHEEMIYYYATIVDEDGNDSEHVIFAPDN